MKHAILWFLMALSFPLAAQAAPISDWYHLSEGSEFFPTDWLLALEDAGTGVRKPIRGARFVDTLGTLGAQVESSAQTGNPYLFDWIGLTAAWSDHDPRASDALKGDERTLVRWVQGPRGARASIKMTGINCSYCHSTTMRAGGQPLRIEGGAGRLSVDGIFEGVARATLTTMLKPAMLTRFLRHFGVRGAAIKAPLFSLELLGALGLGSDIELITGKPGKHFYGKNEVVARYLVKLLEMTHGLKGADLGILKARMQFLANIIDGQPPGLKHTAPARGRIDAFGGSSNTVLRSRAEPIDTVAPVSVPHLWGVSRKTYFEWEAITNSVLLRNGAQAAALGAAVRNPEGVPAINLHNLERIESWVDRIPTPRWEQTFGARPGFELDRGGVERGRAVYVAQCASCHDPRGGAGPAGALLEPRVFALSAIGTDPAALQTVATPVGSQSFGQAVTAALAPLIQDYARAWGVSQEEIAAWGRESVRGAPFFRDGAGYVAGPLQGIWATAPFLHNGSVPTLRDLLEPVARRPVIFSVDGEEFDPTRVGYRYSVLAWCAQPERENEHEDERCLDTRLAGNRNAGHEFGTELSPADKEDLIAFLKTY